MPWTINSGTWKLAIDEVSDDQWQLTLTGERYSVTFYITDIKETINAVIALNGEMKFPAATMRNVTADDPCVELWLGEVTAYIKVESNLVRSVYQLGHVDVAHIRAAFASAGKTF